MKKPSYKFVVVDFDRHGNERIYYRKPGQRKVRLRGPLLSKDFWEDFEAARRGDLKPRAARNARGKLPPAGTFDRLCVEYFKSADFRRLNPDTRYRKRLVIDPLREKHGEKPAARIEAKHIRRWRDARAEKPHSANALIKALRMLFKFGVEYGHVKSNPAREVSTLKGSVDGYHTWTAAEIEQYQEHYKTGTQQRLALDLMLYTGVRRSDAVLLGRQHIKEGRLVFQPGKGSERKRKVLTIPLHPHLIKSIRATPSCGLTLLETKHGRPWGSRASFGNRFKDWCKQAGLPHCSAHGLRKAATVMLIDAGCSTAQAAAVTGHDSLQVLEHYARERDRARLAEDAIKLLLDGVEPNSTVPLDNPMGDRGTNETLKPLTRKDNTWALAPRTAGKKRK